MWVSTSAASGSTSSTSTSSRTAIWSSIIGSEGFAASTEDGARGRKTGGATAAGGFGGGITAAGGRATDWGVMKRGAGFGGSTGAARAALAAGAAGLAITGAGFAGTADGGATVCRGAPGTAWVASVDGRAVAEPWTALCSTAFRTSPGLEICDRSILGLNSSAGADGRVLRPPLLGSACSAKYFFTRSASSASIELECVFFSVTPTLVRTSRISLLLTSSSRARSLIRIFCMPPYFLGPVISIFLPQIFLPRGCSRSQSPAVHASSPRPHRHQEHLRRPRRLQLRNIGRIRPDPRRCRTWLRPHQTDLPRHQIVRRNRGQSGSRFHRPPERHRPAAGFRRFSASLLAEQLPLPPSLLPEQLPLLPSLLPE